MQAVGNISVGNPLVLAMGGSLYARASFRDIDAALAVVFEGSPDNQANWFPLPATRLEQLSGLDNARDYPDATQETGYLVFTGGNTHLRVSATSGGGVATLTGLAPAPDALFYAAEGLMRDNLPGAVPYQPPGTSQIPLSPWGT